MGIFSDRLKLGSTATLDFGTGQNKGRYCKEELLFLLVSLVINIAISTPRGNLNIVRGSSYGKNCNQSQ